MTRRSFHPRTDSSATPSSRSRARRGEGEMLRDQILDAAEQLLVETGDEDAVSIRAIARAVGVTPPSIYLHFADKDTLLFEVCGRQFARFDEVMEAAGAEASDPVDALRRRGEAYVRFGLEHPEAYRIMFMGQSTLADRHIGAIEDTGRTAFTHHVEAVQRAIDSGGLRADLDPLRAAIFLWSGVHGIASLLISLRAFPWPDPETLVHDLCDLQLRALERQEPT